MPRLFIYPRRGDFSKLSLKEEKIAIGRSPKCDVIVKDLYSSNLHAFIYPSDRGYLLKDNNSKNGTFLNAERIRGEVDLKRGDEILIGSTKILFDKEISTYVEVTRGDTGMTNIRTILPLKDVLKKTDISTSIQVKVTESNLDKIDKEYRLLSVINVVSQELLLHRPKPELIDKIMELIYEILPMDRGTLLLMAGNPPQLIPQISCILNKRFVDKSFQVSQSILNMVLKKHSSLLISDVKAEPQFAEKDSVVIPNIHSAMCVPLWNNKEINGVIYSDRISFQEPFSDEDLRLLTFIANLAAVKIEDCERREKERKADELKKQLELAAQIQRSFLPQKSPGFGGFDVAGHNVPTYLVGGDYYDYIHMGTNSLGVAIADVSGKGPEAAFHMVSFRTRLRVEVNSEYDIQEMAALLNDFVHSETDVRHFITFFFCELNNLTGELKYVNAGHDPPIVVRKKGKIERLGSCGLGLGMFPSEKYDMNSIALNRGDIAVLFTDGITECRDENDKEFNEQRFIRLIKKHSKCSAKKLLDNVFEELDAFSKGAEQMDDMTLVIIKRVK